MGDKLELKRSDDYEEDGNIGQHDWSKLANHIVKLIVHRLPLVDRLAVSTVCRSWRSVMLSVGPHDKLHYGLPCLMYMRESAFHLFDPIYKYKHMFMIPDLSGARVCFSRDGWILLSQRHHIEDDAITSIFFLNPFTKVKIELPPLKIDSFGRFSSSDQPTSESCVVVGFMEAPINLVSICLCRRGDAEWTFLTMTCNIDFYGFLTNPTWHAGSFYCLDGKGNLGVLDPRKGVWLVIGRQNDFCDDVNQQHKQYLVESDGDLLRVCDMGGSTLVFKLDMLTNKWFQVRSLGDKALFVGEQNSISTNAVTKSMEGKVYFNKLQGEDFVSCSPESNLVLPNPSPSGKLKEFLFCSWVDLEWSPSTLDDLDWSIPM